jgi:hypothetical protein
MRILAEVRHKTKNIFFCASNAIFSTLVKFFAAKVLIFRLNFCTGQLTRLLQASEGADEIPRGRFYA